MTVLPFPSAPTDNDGEPETATLAGDIGPTPADRPDVAAVPLPWERPVEHQPIFSPWLLDPVARRAAFGWAARATLAPVAFHTVRAPFYGLRVIARAPWGLMRVMAAGRRWVLDAESQTLIAGTVATGSDGSQPGPSARRPGEAPGLPRGDLPGAPGGW